MHLNIKFTNFLCFFLFFFNALTLALRVIFLFEKYNNCFLNNFILLKHLLERSKVLYNIFNAISQISLANVASAFTINISCAETGQFENDFIRALYLFINLLDKVPHALDIASFLKLN